MQRGRTLALLSVGLLLLGGVAPVALVGFDAFETGPRTDPGRAATVDEAHGESGRAAAQPLLALDPLMETLLGPRANALATGDAFDLLEAMANTPQPSPLAAQHVLTQASTRFGGDPASYPPVPQSPSLRDALAAYATARGLGPLSTEELAALDAVDPVLGRHLVDLVDALTYATEMRALAFAQLSDTEQRALLSSAGDLLRTDAPAAAAERAAARYAELSARVDLGALAHGGAVLTKAAMVTKERLQLDLATGRLDPGGTTTLPHDQPALPGSPDADKLRQAAALLRLRVGLSPERAPMAADEVPPLADAIGGLAARQLAHGASTLASTPAIPQFPSDLDRALSLVVVTYTAALDSSPDTGGAVGGAAATIDALAEALPTLEKWSALLQLTPPDSHFRLPAEQHERVAYTALDATTSARTPEGGLRLAAAQGGLAMPGALPAVPEHSLPDALDLWYAAFDITHEADPDALASSLDALPEDVARALAHLLTAQVEAHKILARTQLSEADEQLFASSGPALAELLSGGVASADRLAALAQFNARASEDVRHALTAALLIAQATELARNAVASPSTTHGEAPNVGAPSPPAPMREAPSSPFSDPARDVWFEDPSGLIVITGYASTTHAPVYRAVALDLGGDDTHTGNAGGALGDAEVPFAVLVDLDGNDKYRTAAPFAQGAAAVLTGSASLPIGVLADYRGDDTYEAGPFSQGASYQGGIGLLFDGDGSDRYTVTGALKPSPARYTTEGGQGYALHANTLTGAIGSPAIGALIDVLGSDTYRAANGQGAAIGIGEPMRPVATLRAAVGLLVEGAGDDVYDCDGVCNGVSRFGSTRQLDCAPGTEGCNLETAPPGDAEPRPGIVTATGTFFDLGGQDRYPPDHGRNDWVDVQDRGMRTPPGTSAVDGSEPRGGLRVNVTVFADLGLADSNGDGIPDHMASALGYDATAAGEGPLATPLATLGPSNLALGPDEDGDGFSDTLERRLGTDPQDRRSAPAGLGEAGGGQEHMLLDLSLDLELGTFLTGRQRIDAGVSGPNVPFSGRARAPTLEGIGSDDAIIGLVAIGDTTATRWNRSYLVSFDLGGDDTYDGAVGGTLVPFRGRGPVDGTPYPALSTLHVDLDGKDRYEPSTDRPTQGAALAGTFAVLVDRAGDDVYRAEDGAQGAALGPGASGVLLELGGNDTYIANDLAQGYAAPTCSAQAATFPATPCGTSGIAAQLPSVALLVDFLGRDTYVARSQGVIDPRDPTLLSTVPYPSRNLPTDGDEVYLGPHQKPPLSSGFPYPYGTLARPTGDSALFIDVSGTDTYRVPGPRDPLTTQAFQTRPTPAGHSLAAFIDGADVDIYEQVVPEGRRGVERYDMNNQALVDGVPYSESVDAGTTVFLDAGPIAENPFAILFPDVVDSAVGARGAPSDANNTRPMAPLHVPGHYPLYLPRLGIAVGGLASNLHEDTFALLVDLGGNDHYTKPVGTGFVDPYAGDRLPIPAALAIDLGGDDRYNLTVDDPGLPTKALLTGASFGAGVLGIGVLVDEGGQNDFTTTVNARWSSTSPALGLSQGAALQGVGVLVLANGSSNLTLTITTDAPPTFVPPTLGLSQGAAFTGIGLLVSRGTHGDDRYVATVEPAGHLKAASQGYAAEGLGLLLDTSGANVFEATGLAQGAASTLAAPAWNTGHASPKTISRENRMLEPRDWAIGALLTTSDRNDTYTTTGLGQGFGWGLDRYGVLLDVAGEDTYRVLPDPLSTVPGIAQGAALPGGVGLLLDQRGDDTYYAAADGTGTSAAQGVAWDALPLATFHPNGAVNAGQLGHATGVLADLAGHDHYEAKRGAQGASLVTGGTALLYDQRGDDTYIATGDAQGWAFLGAGSFVDAGGADRYAPFLHTPALFITNCASTVCPPLGTGNNVAWTNGAAGVGVDAPAIDIALTTMGQAVDAALGGRFSLELRYFAVEEGPDGVRTCSDERLDLSDDLEGLVCITAQVRDASRATPSPPMRVERLRILAIHPEATPAPIVDLVEPGLEVKVLWNTSQAAFVDGDMRVLARAELGVASGTPHGTGWATSEAITLQNDTRLRLDNPPVVSAELPRWLNPSVTPTDLLRVRLLGEHPDASVFVERVSLAPRDAGLGGPCWERILEETYTGAELAEPGLQFNANLVNCMNQGEHVLEVHALDAKAATATEPAPRTLLGIDRTGPTVVVTGPSTINRTLGGAGGFPVTWTASDAFGEVATVKLEVNRDGAWLPWIDGAPKDGRAVWEGFSDGEALAFRAVATDQAGNEGSAGGLTTTIDLTPPRIDDPRVVPAFVRSGQPVRFTINATDTGGLSRAVVTIDGKDHPLSNVGGSGATALLGYDAWHHVSRELANQEGLNASRPAGYAFRFAVTDSAGNEARSLEQQVFIDDVAPVIEGVRLVYPRGVAGGLGDLVRIQVRAEDNLKLADRVAVDASNVSSTGSIGLRQDPASGNFSGVFLLDRTPEPRDASVLVAVRDAAGNVARMTVPVELATKAPKVSGLKVLDVEHTRANLSWATDVLSTAKVVLTDPAQGHQLRFAIDKAAKDHLLELTGLSPATRYVGSLVPANAAGGTGAAKTFELTTPSAIKLELLAPVEDTASRVRVIVQWNASDPSGEPMRFAVRAVSQDPLVPSDLVLAQVERPQGREQTLMVDVTGVPDGTYTLRLEARRGTDRTSASVANVTIDNAAPVVRLLDPGPGSIVAPGMLALRAAALDPLTGIREGSVTFTADGDTVVGERQEDGTYTATIPVPATERFELWVDGTDNAGNHARDGGPLFVDPDAPTGVVASLVLPGDQATAKRGDKVLVKLTAPREERALTASVRAGPLTGADALPMRASTQAWTASFVVPDDASEGLHTLTVDARDPAGNVLALELGLGIDDQAPRIQRAAILDTGFTEAYVEVCANEPTRVQATAASADHTHAPITQAGPPSSCHHLHLRGLRPSQTYEVTLIVTDLAGHTSEGKLELATKADDIPPVGIGPIRTHTAGDGAVALHWAPAADDIGIDGYEILRAADHEPTERPIGFTHETRFIDHNVVPGTSYRYVVRPLDLAGNVGPASDPLRTMALGRPGLAAGTVSPERGDADTVFTYAVNYTGPLDAALDVHVVVDGVPHRMHLDGDRTDCLSACSFVYATRLAPQALGEGAHTFLFTAKAGPFTRTWPDHQRPELGPIVTTGSSSTLPAGTVLAAAGVAATLALAGGALVLLRRSGGT